MPERRELPSRREAITQKVHIGTQGTVYVSVHDAPNPAELFCRVKGVLCVHGWDHRRDHSAVRGDAREGRRGTSAA